MTLHKLQALLETESGEFHAFQCNRYKESSPKHSLMAQAHRELDRDGFIELVGDEYQLTHQGKDTLEAAVDRICFP